MQKDAQKKIKLFKYGEYPRFNDVVTVYVEAEKLNDSVYLYLYDKDGRKTEDDTMMVILKVKDVYFGADTYRRYMTKYEGFLEKVTDFANNFIEKVRADAAEEKHIPLLYIRVFEELGLETAPLYLSREKAKQRKEELKKQEELQKQRQKEEFLEKEKLRIGQVKNDFLAGKDISNEDFLAICRQDGIEIHIRTIGTIRKSISKLNIDGSLNYWKFGKKRVPDFTGCRKAICDFRNMNRKDMPVADHSN